MYTRIQWTYKSGLRIGFELEVGEATIRHKYKN